MFRFRLKLSSWSS